MVLQVKGVGNSSCGGLSFILMVMFVLLALPGFGHAQDPSPLFQCQPSSEQDGLLFTPNIPDFYFNHENAANFRTEPGANLTSLMQDVTYIFTIPPVSSQRDCSGTVVAMEFCYEYQDNEKNISSVIDAFQFLILTRDGFDFTVNRSITVQTTLAPCIDPEGGVHRICCSNTTSNNFGELVIPSSDIIFGIAHMNDFQLRFLAFSPMVMEYRFDQFQQITVEGFSLPGTTVSLAQGTLVTDHSLPLIRFFIDGNTSEDNPADTMDGAGISTTTPSSGGGGAETATTDDDGTTTASSSTPGRARMALIGGVVGGTIVVILVLLLLILLIILLVRKRRKETSSTDISYNNALYEVTETKKSASRADATEQEADGGSGDGHVYSVVDVSHKKQKYSEPAALEVYPVESEGMYSVVTSENGGSINGDAYSSLGHTANGGENAVLEAYSALDHTAAVMPSAEGGAYNILDRTTEYQNAGTTEPTDEYAHIESAEEYGRLEHC